MGLSRQEYWSGLPCPPPRDLSDPGIETVCLMSPALADGSLSLVPPGKPLLEYQTSKPEEPGVMGLQVKEL